MKKEMILSIAGILLLLNFVFASQCLLEPQLINQDPYPAVPGDYVELVFQVSGVQNPECGEVSVSLVDKYPIKLDPNQIVTKTVAAGTFTKDYSSFLMVPYKVRIDEDALDGGNPIELSYSSDYQGKTSTYSKNFTLNVENVKADFEIFVKDYDATTKTLTFEVLNIAESDVQALTIELPKQDSINVKGSNRNIVGDLDSNEYTTADFEATPLSDKIRLTVYYTDSNGVRRTIEKEVEFDSSYFENRNGDTKQSNTGTYVVLIIVLGLVAYYFYRRHKRKHAQKK